MIVYGIGDKIKVKEDSSCLGVKLKKGMEGIVVSPQTGRVEAAFEGLGLVSVDHGLIKKKVRKTERLVKAKNVKVSDEVRIPGISEYSKVANIFRDDYDSSEPPITIETVEYDANEYGYHDLVEVRR